MIVCSRAVERGAKPTNPNLASARPQAHVEVVPSGDVTLLNVVGLVDERFKGFGAIDQAKTVVINVAGITRMTSFGVRQWLSAIDSLPKSVSEVILLGCPTFFVDQLNMVLNFGGSGKVLTFVAPYACPSCGVESGELIDVLAERSNLANGGIPEKECTRCGAKLELDETPESYFSFARKYAASSIQPATAQLLAQHGLYTAADTGAEKPPRIIKLVEGSVTYFRIIGRIGSMFRARPFLGGAEGEVVIDLAEVEAFDPEGQKEWRRLLKNLSGQQITVTLVDVKEQFFVAVGETFAIPNVNIETLIVQYVCVSCKRRSQRSASLRGKHWPPHFEDGVCTGCGGVARHEVAGAALVHLKKASMNTPPSSAQLIDHREELLARTMTDASAASQPTDAPSHAVTSSDLILGKYKIVRRLHSSGVTESFLAKQVGIGGFEKPVVLTKLQRSLLEQRERAIEMFLNEVKLAGRLTHPNIAQVLDVGEVGGSLYVAVEYVNGKTVRDIIDRLEQTNSLMPVAEACYVAREVALALDYAFWSIDMRGQRLGVGHGDVAPHNIMVSYDGTVKVLDFGIAISLGEHEDLQYVDPESANNAAIDHRSDLFSVGVLLYQLCSGTKPFAGSSYKEIVKRIKSGKCRPLHEVATVPARLGALVATMISPNVEERPQRGQDIVAELSDIARRSGFESSAANLARFLMHLFPNDDATNEPPAEPRPVRTHTKPPLDNLADAVAISRTRSGHTPGIDASISFVGRSREASMPPNTVASDSQPTPSVKLRKSWWWTVITTLILIALIAGGAYLLVTQHL